MMGLEFMLSQSYDIRDKCDCMAQLVGRRVLGVLSIQIVAGAAFAGPHEGGTVILHANPDIVYTSDSEGYCGKSMIESCEEAISRVSADPTANTVFFAMAAFPADSNPDLIAVTFGIDYDLERFVLTETGHCAELELNTSDWPLPGSGTILAWDAAQHEQLLELRWFAGYAVSADLPTTFELTFHPTQGGIFIGGGVVQPIDDIAGFGVLGFGTDGHLPCPDGPIPVEERSWGGLKTQFR